MLGSREGGICIFSMAQRAIFVLCNLSRGRLWKWGSGNIDGRDGELVREHWWLGKEEELYAG